MLSNDPNETKLKEKLNIIEDEAKFSHQNIKAPNLWVNVLRLFSWVIMGGVCFLFHTKPYFTILFFSYILLIPILAIIVYFREKKLYSLYSTTCRIIKYYKNK